MTEWCRNQLFEKVASLAKLDPQNTLINEECEI